MAHSRATLLPYIGWTGYEVIRWGLREEGPSWHEATFQSFVNQNSVLGVVVLIGGWAPHGALLVCSPLENRVEG